MPILSFCQVGRVGVLNIPFSLFFLPRKFSFFFTLYHHSILMRADMIFSRVDCAT